MERGEELKFYYIYADAHGMTGRLGVEGEMIFLLNKRRMVYKREEATEGSVVEKELGDSKRVRSLVVIYLRTRKRTPGIFLLISIMCVEVEAKS